jgi:uncharacterized protein (DUF1778 family)
MDVTVAQKSLIQRAAELVGRTVTNHMIARVQGAAKWTVETHETIILSTGDSRAFVEAMLDPRPVNDRLRNSVRRYRELTGA